MAHTMREVAKRAGVSLATVSRVLNNTQYISEGTRRRVLEVVKEFNYFKNVHARRLATGRSDLFGLVISEIANPFFPEIIRGFQAVAWNRGFDVLLCNTEYDLDRTKTVIRKLRESGTAVLLVEQLIDKALALADRVYALARGSIVLEAGTKEADLHHRLEHAYFATAGR